jgi:hypothetical protein
LNTYDHFLPTWLWIISLSKTRGSYVWMRSF